MPLSIIDVGATKYTLSTDKSYIIIYRIGSRVLTDLTCCISCIEDEYLVLKNAKKIKLSLIEKIIEL